MPRDDLSIDFVKRMPQGGEALDPALILDDFINRVANLPEEVRFIQDEIAEKDQQFNECLRIIEERDGRIQKFIKANGSHEINPREDAYRKTIVEYFEKAEELADEKIALTQRIQVIIDRHTRQLDMQIKQLYDRAEPGFTDPDELPSLLRPTAANKAAAAMSRDSPAASPNAYYPATSVSGIIKEAIKTATSTSGAGGTGTAAATAAGGRLSTTAQARQAAQQGHSSSAPASPAASMTVARQTRDGSAGPGVAPGKRGPRTNSTLANVPPVLSGLARHSSLGPGTPKSHAGAGGVPRAGSGAPRTVPKGAAAGFGRKGNTPAASSGSSGAVSGLEKTGPGRKKGNGGANTPTTKSGLSRTKRPAKASAASSTADESELSDASFTDDSDASPGRGTPIRGSSQGGSGAGFAPESMYGSHYSGNGYGAGSNKDGGAAQPLIKREKDHGNGVYSSIGSPAGNGHGTMGAHGPRGPRSSTSSKHRSGDKPGRSIKVSAPSSDDPMELDEDDAGDDNKYCLCQNVSFGDMVACDNEDCPFEWFHWSCVGLKNEPNGTWYCPVCTEEKRRNAADASRDDAKDSDGGAHGSSASSNGSASSASTAGVPAGEGGTPAATKKGK